MTIRIKPGKGVFTVNSKEYKLKDISKILKDKKEVKIMSISSNDYYLLYKGIMKKEGYILKEEVKEVFSEKTANKETIYIYALIYKK